MNMPLFWIGALLGCALMATAVPTGKAADMQAVDSFEIDKTEVTIGAFAQYVAATGVVTKAERDGGGHVYELGWSQKPGWYWRAPYGKPGSPREPVAHVTYAEADAYCRWAGKRLPTDTEWVNAAYTEHRASPPAPFVRGKTYSYPTGSTPQGAHCLEGCGTAPAVAHGARLLLGRGHAEAGRTTAGVNGLYDMGANLWEWTNIGSGAEKRTRGGSWWYGPEQMRANYIAGKPGDFTALYIGFRCARDLKPQ
jgi:formylglycine-generating enzyme